MKPPVLRCLFLLALCSACCNLAAARVLFQGAEEAVTVTGNDDKGNGGGNLKNLDCASRVHPNCTACYQSKEGDTGAYTLLCRTCSDGMRLTQDLLGCECSIGFYMNTTTRACMQCPEGSICIGGSAQPEACGTGMTTLTRGARTKDQCVARAGFSFSKKRTWDDEGREKIEIIATPCPINFFSTGKSQLPCRPCPAGLITLPNPDGSGATSKKECIAPAGSAFDKGIAKPCPRGTFAATAGNGRACAKCPNGLTTPEIGSKSQAMCYQAMPGHRVVTPGVKAEKCRRGTFNAGYNNATECVGCEAGMVTKNENSKDKNSCLAPPGYGYNKNGPPSQRVQPCPIGFYKEGYNLKPCLACGQGMKTNQTASTSKGNCMVPPGSGTRKIPRTSATTASSAEAVVKSSSAEPGNEDVQVSADNSVSSENGTTFTDENGIVYDIVVEQCMNGTYGYPDPVFGIMDLPCRPCGSYMATMDQNPEYTYNETDPVINVNFDACVTLPGYGWDPTIQATIACRIGTYSEGWGLVGCTPCKEGYTTATTGAANETFCEVAPGFFVDLVRSPNGPIICDEGDYCPGFNVTEAQKCPSTTWSLRGANEIRDCHVCIAGHGSWVYDNATGPSCTKCAVNTYAPKGGVEACAPCPINQYSMAGSSSDNDCYDQWQKLKKDFDYLPVTDATLMTVQPGTYETEEDCRLTCDVGCVFFQWNKETKQCSLHNAPANTDGTVRLGMKVDVGVYGVYASTAEAKTAIGEVLPITVDGAQAEFIVTPDVNTCMKRCDDIEACVALFMTKTPENNISCRLRAGAISVTTRSKYKLSDGSSLNNWFAAAS